jgi:hypothetical protein
MTQQLFDVAYPKIASWIEQTIAAHSQRAVPVAALGFKRLPQYFLPNVLTRTNVVYVPKVPVPPLASWGFREFSDFEKGNFAGITYLNTFFSRRETRGDEAHHFHELIHVIQWQVLGPKSFLGAYADGLSRIGYRNSPLEVMAYTLERVFRHSDSPFDVAAVVGDEIHGLHRANAGT